MCMIYMVISKLCLPVVFILSNSIPSTAKRKFNWPTSGQHMLSIINYQSYKIQQAWIDYTFSVTFLNVRLD